MSSYQPTFSVISGKVIHDILSRFQNEVIDIVKSTYLAHGKGDTVNPDSYFLRFPERPKDRIIALPAAINAEEKLTGIKWIASYPDNIKTNLQRASASLILNDYETGYPYACLEASQISSARTAASAVLAAGVLSNDVRIAKKIAFVGAGVIARTILAFFKAAGWAIGTVSVFDLNAEDGRNFAASALADHRYEARVEPSLQAALEDADVVVFATTAAVPYVLHASTFTNKQLILNVSLRDLSPEIIQASNNVFDDIEHCMKANTSPHLAELKYGNRDFANGTLADVINGRIKLDPAKPTVFSPFGLGVLDLAVGQMVYQIARKNNQHHEIADFFYTTSRWGNA